MITHSNPVYSGLEILRASTTSSSGERRLLGYIMFETHEPARKIRKGGRRRRCTETMSTMDGTHVEIKQIFVRREARGRGIGQRLMAKMEEMLSVEARADMRLSCLDL